MFPTPVHARYDQLLTLPKEIRGKMWLCGYQPGPKPDAVADGFLGFVKRGQVFDFPSPDPIVLPTVETIETMKTIEMIGVDRLSALTH